MEGKNGGKKKDHVTRLGLRAFKGGNEVERKEKDSCHTDTEKGRPVLRLSDPFGSPSREGRERDARTGERKKRGADLALLR